MATEPIYLSEDHYVVWTGANDSADDSYLNSATVTYALKDADGTTVSGGTGTCSYVAASNGNYRGTIESTVTSLLTVGEFYYLEITFSQSAYNGFRRIRLKAQYRAEN